MRDTDPPKKKGWNQVVAKGKQFLLLIRHLSYYSYIYIVKSGKSLLGDRAEQKEITYKEKESIAIGDMHIS